MKMIKFAIVLAALILSGCSQKNSTAPSAPQSAPMEGYSANITMEMDASYGESTPASEAVAYEEGPIDDVSISTPGLRTESQKIILEAYLNMATDNFDKISEDIRVIAVDNGGYIQDSNQYAGYDGTRYLSITVRVPFESYELVLERFKNLCVLKEATENQRNVTAEYYDIQSRLETKLIEEERLLSLITRTQKVEEILKLEELLGRVRTQIELYQSQMTDIDRLSSYSTITMQISEVPDETAVAVPANLSGRMYESFVGSINQTIRLMQNTIVMLVGISVPLFVFLIAAVVIVSLFRLKKAMRKFRNS